MYIHICVYIYIYIHMYVYIYIYIYICLLSAGGFLWSYMLDVLDEAYVVLSYSLYVLYVVCSLYVVWFYMLYVLMKRRSCMFFIVLNTTLVVFVFFMGCRQESWGLTASRRGQDKQGRSTSSASGQTAATVSSSSQPVTVLKSFSF